MRSEAGPAGKAGFRALRDELGLSLADVSGISGASVRSVRRWEAPGFPPPPEDVREVLADLRDRMSWHVEQAKEVAVSQSLERGGDPSEIVMTYYRDQGDYDGNGRDAGPVGFVNACTRAVARELEGLGYRVTYRYPGDGAVETPGSGY